MNQCTSDLQVHLKGNKRPQRLNYLYSVHRLISLKNTPTSEHVYSNHLWEDQPNVVVIKEWPANTNMLWRLNLASINML